MEVDVVSLSSEFPNDNPALHRGTIWVCLEPTGRVQAEPPSLRVVVSLAEMAETAPLGGAALPFDVELELGLDEIDDPAIVVEELEPLDVNIEVVATDRNEPSAEPPSVGLDRLLAMSEAPPTVELTDAVVALADESVLAELDELDERGDDLERASGRVTVEVATSLSMVDEPATALVCEQPSEIDAVDEPVALWSPIEAAESIEEGVRPTFDEIPEVATAQHDSSARPKAPDDPFTVLVCTLADVAIQAGSPNVASVLPGLLFDGRLPDTLDADVSDALRAAGLWDGQAVAGSFVTTTCAWRAILRGTSDDFDACGAAMLDEWASDLLSKLLSAPANAPTLRQELRSRGVAAFGLAA